MKILGICDNHDAGAALVIDNKIVAAVNEERLNRIKNYVGFPKKSIKEVLRIAKISPKDIDLVLVGSEITPSFILRFLNSFHQKNKKDLSQFSFKLRLYTLYQYVARKFKFPYLIDKSLSKVIINKNLRKLGIKSRIKFIEHHLAHATAAYKTSPFKRGLIFTFDAMGDGITLTVNIGKDNKIRRISSQYGISEVGYHYSRITELLGFIPNRHEGKITGMAAFGKDKIDMSPFFSLKDNKIIARRRSLKEYKKLKKYKKEDIAASTQQNFEKVVSGFIRNWINKTDIKDIALVGGIFANVKLNQRIKEIPEVNNIYVFPHMGDGGLALGAALAPCKRSRLENVYLGPGYTEQEIEEELKRSNLKYSKKKNIEKEVANLLHQGEIVCRFYGRMEYGPRALGNRSILAPATDNRINKRLNDKLNRTEFMPFAPSTLKERSHSHYFNLKGAESSSVNMTISFNCKKKAKENNPATTHIDDTARPQIVDKEKSPSYYKIIKEYERLTGNPTILNTSFNLHEEPIICSHKDAIKSFKRSKINYMAIGNYMLENEK